MFSCQMQACLYFGAPFSRAWIYNPFTPLPNHSMVGSRIFTPGPAGTALLSLLYRIFQDPLCNRPILSGKLPANGPEQSILGLFVPQGVHHRVQEWRDDCVGH